MADVASYLENRIGTRGPRSSGGHERPKTASVRQTPYVGFASRLDRMGGRMPVQQQMTQTAMPKYSGKAGGAGAIGPVLKGIGGVMMAIENYQALKLEQEMAVEKHDMERAKEIAEQMELVKAPINDMIAGLNGSTNPEAAIGAIMGKISQAGLDPADFEGDIAYQRTMPSESKKAGMTKKEETVGVLEGEKKFYGEEGKPPEDNTAQERAITSLMKQNQSMTYSQAYEQIIGMGKSGSTPADEQKLKLEIESKKLDVQKKRKDLNETAITKAAEMISLNWAIFGKSPEQIAETIETLAEGMSIALGEDVNKQGASEMFDDIINYGSKEAALAAINARTDIPEALRKKAISIANQIDKEDLWSIYGGPVPGVE